MRHLEFCDKCGSLMVPVKNEKGELILKCRQCGFEKPVKSRDDYVISQEVKKDPKDEIIVVEDDSIPMPKVKVTCPKCGNNEAYYWQLQTRSADEAMTEFYKCTKCGHTWRNYGGY